METPDYGVPGIREGAKTYLAVKQIPQLFQSMITGLLHHRPDNPLDFIDVCLERIREIGSENIRWNTFVEETDDKPCLLPGNNEGDKR